MARKFYDHSPYVGVVDYDESKISDVLVTMFDNPTERIAILVVNDEGQSVGMLCGMVSEILFSRERIATELAWWMDPEYRANRIGIELINAFEYWARHKAQCKFVQLSTIETEQVERISKFYKRKGYDLFERGFVKVIN